MRTRDPLQDELMEELFEALPAALAVIDADLRFVRFNKRFAAVPGRSYEELIGKTLEEILGERATLVRGLVRRALAGETIRDIAFRATEPGNEAHRYASYIPLRAGGEVPSVLMVLTETAAPIEVERTLQFTRDRLELTLESASAGIFEWRSAGNELRWSDGLGPLFGRARGWAPDDYEQYMAVLYPDDRDQLAADVATAVETGDGYEREFRALWPNGHERWLQSRVEVVDDGEGSYTLLGLVSDIHRRKVREHAEEVLAKVGRELGASLDLSETVQRLARLVVPDVADWCEITLFDERSEIGSTTIVHRDPELNAVAQRLHPLTSVGPNAAILLERLRSGEAHLLTNITLEQLVDFSDSEEQIETLRLLHPTSILSVPMIARGRLIGALSLYTATEARAFGKHGAQIAEEIARRAAIAIDNAVLFEEQQAATRRLVHLQTVTDATLDNLELDDLLNELLRRVASITGAEYAAILLYDPERRELNMSAAQGLPGAMDADVRPSAGEGVAGRVFESGEPIFLAEVRDDDFPIRHGGDLRDKVKSVLAVPLHADEAVIGVLQVGTLAERRIFTDADTDLLTLVAERAARGIVNASLYARARSTSTLLQSSLLPDSLPEIEGYELEAIYRPGQGLIDVGGDWYDAFGLPDGCFAITLGDVVGRGVHAAALMGQLRAATRAYAREHRDPATVLSHVDELVEDIMAVPFATAVLLVLDPETGVVDVASAGHPPIMMRSRGLVETIVGPAIGAPVQHRESSQIKLDKGDLLVLYSDGMVEVRSEPLQARLEQIAAAVQSGPEQPRALLDHLEQTMLGSESTDDAAAVVLRRSP